MIKIKEIQYQKYNPQNKQERIIEYSSWLDYCSDLLIFDGMKHMQYPSIPRQTRTYIIKDTDNKIILEYFHRVINENIIHEGILL